MTDVTVLITAYNTAGDLLRETVRSALSQEVPGLEVLVVDDGSELALEGHLREIADPRLVYHRITHQGLPHALIEGVRLARGSFIAILDHDDRLPPGSLALRLEAMRQHRVGLVYGDIQLLSPSGEIIGEHVFPAYESAGSLVRACLVNPIGPMKHGAILFDRNVAMHVGNYDPALPVEYDLDLVVRIIRAAGFRKVRGFVAQYRIHPGNFSASLRYRMRQIHYRWLVMDRYMKGEILRIPAKLFVAATNLAKGLWQATTYRRPGFLFTGSGHPREDAS